MSLIVSWIGVMWSICLDVLVLFRALDSRFKERLLSAHESIHGNSTNASFAAILGTNSVLIILDLRALDSRSMLPGRFQKTFRSSLSLNYSRLSRSNLFFFIWTFVNTCQDFHSLRFFGQVLKLKAGDSLPLCGCWFWLFASLVVISEPLLHCGCTAEATSGTISALITLATSCAWRAPFVRAAAALRCRIVSRGFNYQDAPIIEPLADVRVGDFVALRSCRLDCRLACTCHFFLAGVTKSCSLVPSSIIQLRSDPFLMALFTDHSGLSFTLTTV